MPDFTLIDPGTGQILSTGNVPVTDLALQNLRPVTSKTGKVTMVPDNSVIVIEDSVDGRTQYWRNNKIVARPKLTDLTDMHLDLDEIYVIKRVPRGTEVTMIMGSDVQMSIVEDGKIEIMSRHPAFFELIIRPPFPWQRQQIAVSVA